MGLVILGILDSSFLFLPVGNDLLLVILVARNHAHLPLYVAAASLGSMIGVLLLDLVCRKGGEEGLKKILSPSRFDYLKKKISQRAAAAIILACVAPPPFPFTAVIAAASAFQYPRPKLLAFVFAGRTMRFTALGLAALWFGRGILRIIRSTPFEWFMGAFIAVCVIGSTMSLIRWIRIGRSQRVHA